MAFSGQLLTLSKGYLWVDWYFDVISYDLMGKLLNNHQGLWLQVKSLCFKIIGVLFNGLITL